MTEQIKFALIDINDVIETTPDISSDKWFLQKLVTKALKQSEEEV